MKTVVLILALAFGAVGCGKSDKRDNSNIQTPNDQPIGPPQSLGGGGGGKPAQLGAPPATQKNTKAFPTVEVKP